MTWPRELTRVSSVSSFPRRHGTSRSSSTRSPHSLSDIGCPHTLRRRRHPNMPHRPGNDLACPAQVFLDRNILIGEYFDPWIGSHRRSETARGGASSSSL